MPIRPRLDQAASNKRKRRQFDVLLNVTAPHERIVFICAALLMLTLLVWALFGRIEYSITFDGLLIKPGVRYEVTSAESGYLIEYLALPGNDVKAGDLIARQSVPELDREIAALHQKVDLFEQELAQAHSNNASARRRLETARAALVATEAQREVREMIVAHTDGEIMTLQFNAGDFVSAGSPIAWIRGNPDTESASFQALIQVDSHSSQRIRLGMEATVDVELLGNDLQQLAGTVVSVSEEPLPNWLTAMPPAINNPSHRIDIALRQMPKQLISNSASCRVRIILGESSPFSMLASTAF